MAPKSSSTTPARLPREAKTTAPDAIHTFFDPKHTPATKDDAAHQRRVEALVRRTAAQRAESRARSDRIKKMYPGDRKKQIEEIEKQGVQGFRAATEKELEEYRERLRRWNAGEEAELLEEAREFERAQWNITLKTFRAQKKANNK